MKTVFAKAPLRMALAGGGTDLEPYYTKHGGFVLNATIDQYAYCKVEPNTDCTSASIWSFNSIDLGASEIHNFMRDELLEGKYLDTKLKLLVNTYQHLTSHIDHIKEHNKGELPVKITTYVEAPPGSGLGSSSALVVALIAAITEYYNIPMGEYDIAELAVEIERKIWRSTRRKAGSICCCLWWV